MGAGSSDVVPQAVILNRDTEEEVQGAVTDAKKSARADAAYWRVIVRRSRALASGNLIDDGPQAVGVRPKTLTGTLGELVSLAAKGVYG